jgi:hypothetical protein
MNRNRETGPGNQRDSDRLRRLENLRASEIPVDTIAAADGSDVQAVLESLAGVAAGLAAGASYANDAAAAAGGVAVGEFYRNGSVVQVRVV